MISIYGIHDTQSEKRGFRPDIISRLFYKLGQGQLMFFFSLFISEKFELFQ